MNEVIVPGGICGAFGVLLIIISTTLAVYALPDYALFVILAEALGAIACAGIGIYMLSRSGISRALRLDNTQRPEDGYVNVPTDASLIGQTGVVFSALRPAGAILLGEIRYDAVSNGAFIKKDEEVRVIEVHGNRIVVETLEEEVS